MKYARGYGKKGSVLISTLWITAILALLAMGIGFRVSLEVRLSKYHMDKLEARYLAKAGIAKAQEFLLKGTNESDSLYACGISPEAGGTPESIFGAEYNKLGNGAFSVHYTLKKEDEEGGTGDIHYGMADEERKINLNMDKLARGNKAEFKRILKGLSPDMTEEIVNAVIDWQDTDTSASFPGGAEDFDYEAEFGYGCKDEELESVQELLLVKGMTAGLYGEIKDYVTVYGNGKININTVSREALRAIIDDGTGTYAELVNDILAFRNGDDEIGGTADDRIFASTDELKLIVREDDIHGKTRIDMLLPYFTVKSENFRIISHGEAGKIRRTITWVGRKGAGGELEILYYHEK